MDMNSIIRDAMVRRNITVTDLSERTGIGRVSLGYKLKGKREMTVKELGRIARELKLTAKELEKGIL